MLKKYVPDMLLILIAIIWALNFSVVKVSLEEIDALSFNALRYVLAAGLLAFTTKKRGYPLRVERQDVWPLIGIAYLIWNNSVSKIGAVRTAAYQNLVPVLGLVFGVVLLQEALTLQQYSGSAMVIAGIIFSRF